MKRHYLRKDNFKYKCDECNSAYKHLTSLRRHIRKAHDHRRYLCRSCNIYFKRKHDLKRHNVKTHPRLILESSPSNFEYSVPEQTKNSSITLSNNVDDTNMIRNQPSTSTPPSKPAQWVDSRQPECLKGPHQLIWQRILKLVRVSQIMIAQRSSP